MNPVSTADVLERAAEIIEAGGLAKDVFRTSEGQHCAVGAIAVALGRQLHGFDDYCTLDDWEDLEIQRATEAVFPVIVTDPCFEGQPVDDVADSWGLLVDWNNHEERTDIDVIDAFRRAAKGLRNEAVAE